MSAQQFPTSFPVVAPAFDDQLLFSDTDNANTNSVNTIELIVKAGLGASTTDFLPQGAVNLYLTVAEQTKLAGIAPGAQVNAVDSVNGFIGPVSLTQDDIPDGVSFVQTEENFSSVRLTQHNTSFAHVSDLANPHAVTNVQVGLGNVTNDAQLKRDAADFDTFPQKVSLHAADLVLIEDSVDSLNKKKVEIGDISTEVVQNLPVANSVEVSGGNVQLVNDTPTPPEDSYYGNEEGALGFYVKYDKNVYGGADLFIPTGRSMVVHGGLQGVNSIDGPGGLYLL